MQEQDKRIELSQTQDQPLWHAPVLQSFETTEAESGLGLDFDADFSSNS